MRFEDLYIDGFGCFADTQIGPFDQSVSIISGPNEAGKSTLLAFIRTMLFGFPYQHRNYYPPQAGGRHGGRITIVDDQGGRIHLERFAGPRGGQLAVTSDGGAPLGQLVLNQLLGYASEDLFKNIFAFSLNELQNKDSLNNDSVIDQIYSAGLGVSRLPQAFNELRTERDRLLRPRAKSLIGDLLEEFREVDAKLTTIKGNATEYGRLMARQAIINDELDGLIFEKNTLIGQQRDVQRLKDGWEDWLTLLEAEERLDQIPEYDRFPSDAVVRLNQLLGQLKTAEQESSDVSGQLIKTEAEAQAVVEDDDMLEDQVIIERLRRGRESLDGSLHDLPERELELKDLEESFSGRLRDLNPNWDEAQFESFDMSIATRDEIAQRQQVLGNHREQFRESDRQLQQDQRRLGDLESSMLEAKQAIEQAEEPHLDSGGLEQRRAALRVVRTQLAEFEQAKQRHEDLSYQLDSQAQASPGKNRSKLLQHLMIPILAALAGGALIAAGVISGEESRLIGVVAGAALLSLALFLYFKPREGQKPGGARSTEALITLVNSAKGAIDKSAATLSSSVEMLDLSDLEVGALGSTDLDGVESKLANVASQLAAWEKLNEVISLATREYERQERRVAESAESLTSTQEKLESVQDQWQVWLRELGLPQTFTPETVIEFRERIETARLQLGQIMAMRQRIAAIQRDIEEYRLALDPIILKYGGPRAMEEQSQLGMAADRLIERFDTARKLVERRALQREEVEKIKIRFDQRETQRLKAERSLNELLEAGGVTDAEEFRRRADQYSARKQFESKKDDSQSHLRRLSGPGSQFEVFRETLSRSSRSEIEDSLGDLADQLEGIETSRQELSQERGSNETLLSQLASEKESSELRLQRDVLLEKLRVGARDWSKNRIADWLLRSARKKFEEERQPGVIQHAEKFLTTITGGHYNRLYTPIGEQTFTVSDRTGRNKQPTELSRGTLEQLYLSLRFGLFLEFGEHSERLPVVVDEVLVNFDPDRARRAASAFVELAQTNQVMVFTCHPSTVEIFKVAAPNAKIISI